jgi:hypothetical protein
MIPSRPRRVLRWALWSSAALVLLAAAALFVAPALLDLPVVRAKLERQLSEAAKGRLQWDELEVRLFPVPRGVLKGVRIDIREIVSGRVDEVDLHLRAWRLLAGHVEVTKLRMVRPVLRVDMAKLGRAGAATGGGLVAAYRRAVQPVADAVRRFAPDLALSVEDAQIDMILPGLPPFGQVGLMAEGRSDADGLELSASAAGKLWAQLRAKLRVEYADLQARAEIDGSQLRPQPFLDQFLAGAGVSIAVPAGNVHAEAHTDGKTTLAATVKTEIPALTVTRDNRSVALSAAQAQADVTVRGEDIEVTLNAVRLGELVPLASARLHVSGTQQKVDASLEVPAFDLNRLRDVAATLASDTSLVRDYLMRVRGGQVTDLHVAAQAQDLKALLDPASIDAHAKLERTVMLAPFVEQEVSDISGALAWSKGTLSAQSLAGRLAKARLSDGSVDYVLRDRLLRIGLGYDVDLAQTLGLARQLLPRERRAALDVVTAAVGRAEGRFTLELKPGAWRGEIAVARSDSQLRLRDVPWPVRVQAGRATVAPGRLTLADAAGAVGASTFADIGGDVALGKPLRLDSARGSARLALAELYPWLRAQPGLKAGLQKVASVTGSVDAMVNRVAGGVDRIDLLQYDVTLRPRQVRVEVEDLPAPLSIDGGSVNVTPQTLRFQDMVSALLDARVAVSGVVRDYRTQSPQVDASLANGQTGKAFVAWVWERAAAPDRLLPKTPARFAAQRVRWTKTDGLDVRASVQVETGPAVDADVGWKRDVFDVRSLHIKDQESDATLGLLTRGRLLDTRFAGVLTGRSVEGLFARSAGERTGRVEGDFRATIDRDLRGRSTMQGRLTGERIQFERLLGLPLQLERIDLNAADTKLRVNEASIDYAEQKVTIRGEVRHDASGLVIDAQLDSPGVVLDRIVPPAAEKELDAAALSARKMPDALAIWPLPVTGTFAVRAGFLQYGRFRVQDVKARLMLEPESARLEVAEADLCGIAFPMTVALTPQGVDASGQLQAQRQSVEGVVRCLTEERTLITGELDLRAGLRSQGKPSALLRNLEGTAEVHMREGKVMKSGLLLSILQFKSVSARLKKGAGRMDKGGFDYRALALRLHFQDGRAILDEGAFDSAALGLAARGSVGLEQHDMNLTVLVAPFGRVDWVVRHVPIAGYILGGTLTSIPISVRGDTSNPVVEPLNPTAVTSELAGVFERTFKLPGKILSLPQEAAKPAQGAR